MRSLGLLALLALPAFPQKDYIKAHYTKYEYRIPMRDGTRLFTVAYVPRDRTRTYPIMMERTPYGVGPYGVDNTPTDKDPRRVARVAPSGLFVKDGFIFVHQDVRGRMMSEGTFVDVRPHRAGSAKTDIDESTDAYDTIDWLVKNVPANSGRVGVWGISYPGFYAAQAAVDAHPALKAVSPQAPVTEWFEGDDFHHNGAFFLADALGFYADFGKPRPKPTPKMKWEWEPDGGDVYEFYLRLGPLSNANARLFEDKISFWNDLMAHGTRDAFWKARDPRPYYKDAKPAVLTVGGFFDAEDLFGALETYKAFEEKSPRAENTLVTVEPWRLGAARRRSARRHHLRRQDLGLLPRVDRAPLLPAAPQRPRLGAPARGVRVRERHQRLEPVQRVAAQGVAPGHALLPRRRTARRSAHRRARGRERR